MARIVKCCILCYLLPTTYCLLSYAYPPGWSDDILLTPEDDKSRQACDVDVDRFNNVWAVWDSATWVSGTAEILYSERDSLGGCLIPETPVSNNPSFSIVPRVAVDASDNVHFIWRDASPQGEGIWHAKLANNGSVIVPSHLAVSGAGSGASTLLPDMVINKYNELYIIWDEYPSGYNQMNFTRLDSMGNPIIEKIMVSIPGIYTYWPGIGVDSFANAHLAYRSDSGFGDRLTYTKLDRDGSVLISNRFFDTGALASIIADRRQNMHIVYADPAGPGNSIEYLKLDQNGDILLGPLTLSVYQNNFRPHMALDSLQELHVVWDAESSGVFPIMYAKLDTLGNFVIPPMQVAYPPHTPGGGFPRVGVDLSNRLHLIWVDGRMNPGVTTDIFYKRGENEPGIEEGKSWIVGGVGLTVCPNPFRNVIYISYEIAESSSIELLLYDICGRLVKDLSKEQSVVGHHLSVTWDGTDNHGNRLPSGVYFLHCSFGGTTESMPTILLR